MEAHGHSTYLLRRQIQNISRCAKSMSGSRIRNMYFTYILFHTVDCETDMLQNYCIDRSSMSFRGENRNSYYNIYDSVLSFFVLKLKTIFSNSLYTASFDENLFLPFSSYVNYTICLIVVTRIPHSNVSRIFQSNVKGAKLISQTKIPLKCCINQF